jgi:hypothetical protein
MSQFEQTVKPLLIPAIQNEPTTWASTEDRTTVARWAFKTALMLDRSRRPEWQNVPDKDFEYLFKHQEPPPSVSILLGWYVPNPGETFFVASDGNAFFEGQQLPSGDGFEGYRITFTVGHVIFQTYGWIDRDRDDHRFERLVWLGDKPIQDAFRRLWPLEPEPHVWPPRGAKFATSGLRLLEPGGGTPRTKPT